MIEVSRKVSMV
jgi:hypothetical protein